MVECDKCRRDIIEVLSTRRFIGNDFNGSETKWCLDCVRHLLVFDLVLDQVQDNIAT
jgi:hypothetical protein